MFSFIFILLSFVLKRCGNMKREIELRIRNDCNFVTCNEKNVKMCGFADVTPAAYVGILDGHFCLCTLRQAQCRAFIFCLELMRKCGKREL